MDVANLIKNLFSKMIIKLLLLQYYFLIK